MVPKRKIIEPSKPIEGTCIASRYRRKKNKHIKANRKEQTNRKKAHQRTNWSNWSPTTRPYQSNVITLRHQGIPVCLVIRPTRCDAVWCSSHLAWGPTFTSSVGQAQLITTSPSHRHRQQQHETRLIDLFGRNLLRREENCHCLGCLSALSST